MNHKKLELLITCDKFSDYLEQFDVYLTETKTQKNVVLKQNGKIMSTIEDDGNSVTFSTVIPGQGIDRKIFTYSELQELRALSQLIDSNGDQFNFVSK